MADNIKKDEEEFSQLQQFAMEEPAPTPQQPTQMAEASTLQEQSDQPTATQAAAPTTQPLIQQQAAAPITPITQQQAAAPIAQQPTPQQLIAQRAAQQAAQRTAQPQMFGQPQQPQPAQPRQTLMTPTTAGQRYRQILQQNVPQAQAVASGLAQVISTPEAEAQKRLADAQQEFQKRIAEAGLDRDEKTTKEIFGRIAQLQAGQEISPEDLAKLEAIAKTKEDFGTGEGIRTEDFLSLENYLQAVSQAQEAQEMARLAGDTGTRQTLLRQLVRRPEYTSGQALLDSLLAGGTAPAAQTIQDVRSRLLEQDVLGKAEEKTLKDIEAARTAEQKEIDEAYEDIQKFLDEGDTGALSGLESDIRDRVVSETARAKELNADIDRLLQPKVFGRINTVIGDTDEERQLIEKLGLSYGDVIRLNGVAPEYRTALIQKLKEDVAAQTVTSAEELAKLNALYKIADITGREAPRLAVAEGEDLGTLAEQKAQIDYKELRKGREQTNTLQTAARENVKEQLRTTDINYDSKPYGHAKTRKATKNTMTAVNDLTSGLKEITEKGLRAKPIDVGELDGVIKELERQNENLAKSFSKLGREGNARNLRTAKPNDLEVSIQVRNLADNYFTKNAGILRSRKGFSAGVTPLGKVASIAKISPTEFKNVKDIDNAIKAIKEKRNTIEEEMARVYGISRRRSPGSPKPKGGFFQFRSSKEAREVFTDAIQELEEFKKYATKVARFEQLKTKLQLEV